jgi:hypothetical protein
MFDNNQAIMRWYHIINLFAKVMHVKRSPERLHAQGSACKIPYLGQNWYPVIIVA